MECWSDEPPETTARFGRRIPESPLWHCNDRARSDGHRGGDMPNRFQSRCGFSDRTFGIRLFGSLEILAAWAKLFTVVSMTICGFAMMRYRPELGKSREEASSVIPLKVRNAVGLSWVLHH